MTRLVQLYLKVKLLLKPLYLFQQGLALFTVVYLGLWDIEHFFVSGRRCVSIVDWCEWEELFHHGAELCLWHGGVSVVGPADDWFVVVSWGVVYFEWGWGIVVRIGVVPFSDLVWLDFCFLFGD